MYETLFRAWRAQQRDKALAQGLLRIGEYTYGYPEVLQYRGVNGKVSIGRYCSIAHDVKILVGGYHHWEWVTTYPIRANFDLPGKYTDGQPYTKGDVVIGSDVWIGEGAFILSGLKVGNGAVIGAHAVCVADIPDYAIVGGNPAKIIRMRFGDAQIQALLRISWWNWDRDLVIKDLSLLCSPNVDEFISKHDPLGNI
jgi:acetyltransferase-like isoleucine patch superfamily enzyme